MRDDLKALPDPVRRYVKHVLGDEQRPIHAVRMTQNGELRTDPRRPRWMKFRAEHRVLPESRSFSWDARVRVLPLLHLRVRDAYADGAGSGQVRLLSMVTVASDRNTPELNAAALHRYLAEAVWYPTALLPSAGVQWSPVDERSAVATLSDRGNTVSLEFRFNDLGEVVGIHAQGRWSRTANGYELTPWEGHFSGYRRHQGVLVPARAEVGWYASPHPRPFRTWSGLLPRLGHQREGRSLQHCGRGEIRCGTDPRRAADPVPYGRTCLARARCSGPR